MIVIHQPNYQDGRNLAESNAILIKMIFGRFDLCSKMIGASNLDVQGSGSDLLISICRTVGDREYLSGIGTENCLDLSLFERSGIAITFQGLCHLDIISSSASSSRISQLLTTHSTAEERSSSSGLQSTAECLAESKLMLPSFQCRVLSVSSARCTFHG